MPLINVDESLNRLLAATDTLESVLTPLTKVGQAQVLAQDVIAELTEPPFRSSAMDGFAIRFQDYRKDAKFHVVGEAAAGKGYDGKIGKEEAIRIFTGAPVPDEADTIIIQENAVIEGDTVSFTKAPEQNANIRPRGGNFEKGDSVLKKGRIMTPSALALCASTGHGAVKVVRRPKIAVLATGNELVEAGEIPGKDQIVCSNSYGLNYLIRAHHCDVVDLGIARDNEESIREKIHHAKEEKVDLLVTSGGVSVGKYDLVQTVLKSEGMKLDFWKVAMRPGKPLMFGILPHDHKMLVLGLPGNPVSSMVCGHIFLVPILEKLSGRTYRPHIEDALLAVPLPENGPRRHFVRANLSVNAKGERWVTPVRSQDSSLIRLMANADCLIIREENGTPLQVGEPCRIFIPEGAGL
ncbi:molybdopterin molybdotransferase MoeA [Bartonella apis]|uniref:molybdopterin molybdotransferase MoeA n=1 Tax=Bartonella apis TaxID=1686310 RepID=UPI0018DBBB04|nr:gephyrin-like molybdotransferase Glp [Bartonella apis]MBI0176361.1 molybdopterin molybdotransferase MoeA [Bartonella apis]